MKVERVVQTIQSAFSSRQCRNLPGYSLYESVCFSLCMGCLIIVPTHSTSITLYCLLLLVCSKHPTKLVPAHGESRCHLHCSKQERLSSPAALAKGWKTSVKPRDAEGYADLLLGLPLLCWHENLLSGLKTKQTKEKSPTLHA